MTNAWAALSVLGNSKWLLPSSILLIVIAVRTDTLSGRTGLRWMVAVAATALVVLISKLAFLGWGVGVSRLDFTGFSGHAAISACVYPLMLSLLGSGRSHMRRLPVAGWLLAGLIAWSRVPLQAHSAAEVILGFLLGAAASSTALIGNTARHRIFPIWLWLLPILTISIVTRYTLPSLDTQHVVVAIAEKISGRDKTYTRQWLHQDSTSTK